MEVIVSIDKNVVCQRWCFLYEKTQMIHVNEQYFDKMSGSQRRSQAKELFVSEGVAKRF